ncbi:MAG: hypothetical protein AAF527_11345 [Pseudomonadota bacterium]
MGRGLWRRCAVIALAALGAACSSSATCDIGGSNCVNRCFEADLPPGAQNDCVRRCDASREACASRYGP